MRWPAVLAVAAALALAGCGDEVTPPSAEGRSAATATDNGSQAAAAAGGNSAAAITGSGFNDTDVMFAQMSVEHIRQGEQVVALAERRASDPEVKALAAELRGQWRSEAATMMGWLAQWQKPLTADLDAGVHAGHGDLHSLRESDIAELAAAGEAEFDRAALSLLLGHLHNCVETARMETAGGESAAAINLANATIRTRQAQVQTMLTLIA
jgi:uncharacterized protein (DUF305 family)